MKYDRQITLSVGNSRKETNWRQQATSVSALYDRLKTPVRGAETLAEYTRLRKSEQDDLKDVGGYVAGSMNGPRRKANAVTGRDVITLDFDNVPAWGADDIVTALNKLGCSYCVYSTRKHAANAPRLRILVPTDRTMSPDEYEPCARRMASQIGIEKADPTTFEVGRLMYWPSCCSDGDYFYRTSDAPLCSVDFLLTTYINWKDVTEWPQVPGSFNYTALKTRQGDPEKKQGIIGTFCRLYDVFRAMNDLIPGVYDPVDTGDENRFTYAGGSTTGGAVVYDEGKFLFSHHATDPCSGKLVNAFDLVRLHKFGDLDADPDAPMTTKTPSYVKMCAFAADLPDVQIARDLERKEAAEADFAGIDPTDPNDPNAWRLRLKRNAQTGLPLHTIDNVYIILSNDPDLAGRIALNEFAGRREVLGSLPWDARTDTRTWTDTDNNGVYWYMENAYGITGRANIDSGVDMEAATHKFNRVREYIDGLLWDGIPRLDTMMIDYLGAADTAYTRAVTRKMFTAAIARAMEPGCKFDNMLILCGPQGIGKSTTLDKMSRGFFNDSISTFEGKEAAELIQGVWLVEIAELDAFRRSDVATIKRFLSLRTDRYRAAYGRNVQERPRTCVFFGTCNRMDFLQDTTGNRRFWPVDVGVVVPRKSVFDDLDADIEQLWAEAKMRWQMGEELFLSGDVAQAALAVQEAHRETNPMAGAIEEFVSKQVPVDWVKWPIDRRRDFWAKALHSDDLRLTDRKQVCAMEVWCELYNRAPGDMKRADAREINDVLRRQPGWEWCGKTKRYGPEPYISSGGIVRAADGESL